jgi:hypothetical protein
VSTHTQGKNRINEPQYPCLVELEPTTPAFEWADAVHVIDHVATVIGGAKIVGIQMRLTIITSDYI